MEIELTNLQFRKIMISLRELYKKIPYYWLKNLILELEEYENVKNGNRK